MAPGPDLAQGPYGLSRANRGLFGEIADLGLFWAVPGPYMAHMAILAIWAQAGQDLPGLTEDCSGKWAIWAYPRAAQGPYGQYGHMGPGPALGRPGMTPFWACPERELGGFIGTSRQIPLQIRGPNGPWEAQIRPGTAHFDPFLRWDFPGSPDETLGF